MKKNQLVPLVVLMGALLLLALFVAYEMKRVNENLTVTPRENLIKVQTVNPQKTVDISELQGGSR